MQNIDAKQEESQNEEKIDVYEHMGEILKGVKSGVLITGKADDKVNSMTICMGNGLESNGENRFLLPLSEKIALQGASLKRPVNLQSAFRLTTVQKKFSVSAVQNPAEM